MKKIVLSTVTVLLISIGAASRSDAQVIYPSTESPPLTQPSVGVPSAAPGVLTPYSLPQPLIQSPSNQVNLQQDLWLQNQQIQRQQIDQSLQQQNQQQLRQVEQQQQMMLRQRL